VDWGGPGGGGGGGLYGVGKGTDFIGIRSLCSLMSRCKNHPCTLSCAFEMAKSS